MNEKEKLYKKLETLTTKRNKNPKDYELNLNVGNVYYELKEYENALIFYEIAVLINPDIVNAYVNMGHSYTKLKEFDKALDCFAKVFECKDDSSKFQEIKAGVYISMSLICSDNNDFDTAIELLEKGVNLNSKDVDLYLNLGNCYRRKGNIDKAIEYFNEALKIENNYVAAWYNLSEMQLLQGDFIQGFKNYEYRLLREDKKGKMAPTFKKPKWQGEDLKGKTIFVSNEQAFGDSIHFCRFFYNLKQKGAKVLFNSWGILAELLKSNELIAPEIVAHDRLKDPEFENEFDYHIQLMSLPTVLGVTKETIPLSASYLFANPQKVENYKNKLKNDKNKFKIGIRWRGNNKYVTQRIIDVRHFNAFKDIPDVSFYSFQLDATPEELEQAPFIKNDLVEYFTDFSQTAAALANMDLLITNDTSMAHLGGAMGTKTWVLLPLVSEWRWGLDIDTTPWYDSVKLFRSKDLMDWTDVFNEVKNELLANFVKV